MDRQFGRRIEFDERSRTYPIRALLTTTKRRSYTWSCAIRLDQIGPSCTGNAVAHEAAARPVTVMGVTQDTALEVYHRAQELDPWPGEDYEGSSVLAAVKAGQERGWYKEYRWAFSEEEVSLAVGYRGPVIVGTNWTEGMMEPDAKGIIHATGSVLGGHAYCIVGYNVKTDLYRILNSWGPEWANNGQAFISGYDLETLLIDQGEAVIPVVRSK
jgi:hypothetical protein